MKENAASSHMDEKVVESVHTMGESAASNLLDEKVAEVQTTGESAASNLEDEKAAESSVFPAVQQRVLVLVGAPGSGKSTIATMLQPDFHRISQDVSASRHPWLSSSTSRSKQVLGSRPKCLTAAEAAMLKGCCVVIDRCNFDPEQRSTWVSCALR
jgi:ABC-type glutathione transport system ATPase component